MAGHNKTRTVPYRILSYLLYGKQSWIEVVSQENLIIRLHTGPASRTLRIKSSDMWNHFYWLESQKLIKKVEKESKQGTVLIHLQRPAILMQEASNG